MLPILLVVFAHFTRAKVDVRFDNTFEYDYSCPWDFAVKYAYIFVYGVIKGGAQAVSCLHAIAGPLLNASHSGLAMRI